MEDDIMLYDDIAGDFDDFDDIAGDEIGLGRFGKALFSGGFSEIRRRRQKMKRAKRAAQVASVARALKRGSFGGRPRLGRSSANGIVAGGQRNAGLGVVPQAVAAGATTILQAQVQEAFQPQRLVVQASLALTDVTVDDIKIGVKSQLAGTAALPGTAFSPDATTGLMQFDPCNVGTIVSITVTNSNAAVQTISGGLFGVA